MMHFRSRFAAALARVFDRAGRELALLVAVAALAPACHILDVTNPDIVTPGSISNVQALPTIRAGALGDFAIAYTGSGAQGSGGSTEGQVLLSGMLSDELINTETFPDRVFSDARRSQPESGTLAVVFRNLHRARRSADVAAARFRLFSDTTTNVGLAEMLNLNAYTYVFFAENYCSGLTFSNVLDDGSFVYGDPLPTQQVYDTAIARFRIALAAASALAGSGAARATQIQLARVGMARALLDEGNFAAADTVVTVAAVPNTFSYVTQHDLNSARQQNGIFNGIRKFKRYGVADGEGGVGIKWLTQADARNPAFNSPAGNKGFDGSTLQWDQNRYLDEKASVTVATGAEARLINAEAALQRGDTAGMLTILNALRAAPPSYYLANGAAIAPLAALAAPVGPVAAVNMLFSERAHWLWLTSHRLSDLRRLERQYGRPDSTTFPTGAYFKNGLTYGTDVNLPIPIDELNNPKFTACIDRNP